MAEIIVPLDKPSVDEALAVVEALGDSADFYKVGLELYTRAGPSVVRELVAMEKRVFLDLKLHDIPNTVGRAVAAASDLGVDFLTIHTAGGASMMEAARDSVDGSLKLLGLTVLTSLSPYEMSTVWGREIRSVREEVGRLAELSWACGIPGIVASALEASWIRGNLGEEIVIVTPGIRPAGADRQDQTRVATPADAALAGSDYLVIGRPITEAPDIRGAYAAILAEVRGAAGVPD